MGRKVFDSKGKNIGTVAEDVCPSCGAKMRPSRRALTQVVNGESIRVRGIAHLWCPQCDEILLWIGHLNSVQQRAVEQYRERYDLLSGVEIQALRERMHLTQSQLTDLLRLGANTVSRWESGRNVQSASMDVLLRLLRDLPQALRYLKKRAA